MPPPEIGAMEPRDACGSATWSTDVADCGNGAVCCRTEVLPDPGRHHTAADDRRAVGCLSGLSTRARFRRVAFSGELTGLALAACRAELAPQGGAQGRPRGPREGHCDGWRWRPLSSLPSAPPQHGGAGCAASWSSSCLLSFSHRPKRPAQEPLFAPQPCAVAGAASRFSSSEAAIPRWAEGHWGAKRSRCQVAGTDTCPHSSRPSSQPEDDPWRLFGGLSLGLSSMHTLVPIAPFPI